MARARVRGASLDAARRSRLLSVLRRAELHPPGLPPHAVLLVRRTRLEFPSEVLSPTGPRAGTRAWEADGRSQLASAVADAARPADGPVPPDAAAVLFRDASELVACLASDTVRGVASTCWWWRTWLGLDPSTLAVVQILRHDVTLLPSVLDRLERSGHAAEVVRGIPSPDARQLLTVLTATFALPRPRSRTGGAAASSAQGEGSDHGERSVATSTAARTADGLPWVRALGPTTVPDDLEPEPAVLLAVALLLIRSPRIARMPAMAAVLRDPTSARRRPGEAGAEPTGRIGGRATGRSAEGGGEGSETPERGSPGRPDSLRRRRTGDLSEGIVSDARAAGIGGGVPTGKDDGVLRRQPAKAHPVADESGGAAAGDRQPTSEDTPVERWRGDEPATPAEVGGSGASDTADASVYPDGAVATGLAGVFYLVNLFGPLGLPEAVDPAWRLGELTGWALLEVLARGLLDDTDADDPVWAQLAALDGRQPGERVGVELRDPLPTAAPDGWLADAAEHGAVLAAAQPLGPLARDAVASGTAAWLADALPYLRWRLRDALGGTEPSNLLRVPGRLMDTRTHLDIVMPLAGVSLAVRLAGLDRDPGWVPLFGRVVSFRFVEEPAP